MQFPAVMQIDYVRVYQREGQTNVGCDPPNYPTMDYIANHVDAFTSAFVAPFPLSNTDRPADANLTSWPYSWPKNGLYEGGC
jgi:hypothetical protein